MKLQTTTVPTDTLLIILLVLVAITLLCVILFRPKATNTTTLEAGLQSLTARLDSIQNTLRDEARATREEATLREAAQRQETVTALAALRTELSTALQAFATTQTDAQDRTARTFGERMIVLTNNAKLDAHNGREVLKEGLRSNSTDQLTRLDALQAAQRESADITIQTLERITARLEAKLTEADAATRLDADRNRSTLDAAFRGFREQFVQSVGELSAVQKEKLEAVQRSQTELLQHTEKKLEGIRETVDEKLQKTLNERLGQSFEQVSRHLEGVQKGLGEMQALAQDVGGLKRVLSNVKMRGGFGEVQLHMLLENILAPEQYEANVATKTGSADRVEFAVKFPYRDADRQYVWLPIDAKFPKDAYEHLQNAYDAAEPAAIEAAQKSLDSVIRKMAGDICSKYIDVPNTTNFGILFLPFEGLFAEVVRKASLLEEIQRTCNVIVTGPTTLAVILNGLQMGFRTLAIQKRSAEVWKVLGEVKGEFDKFGGLLEKAQTNIQTGLNHLDGVVGVRTRAIQRKLKGVELHEEEEPALPEPAEILKIDGLVD